MIVPMALAHFEAMYGERPVYRIRGYAVVDGDEVLAVAGLYITAGHFVGFANVSEAASQRPKEIIRLMRKTLPLLDGKSVFAYQDRSLPTSHGVLSHLGFEPFEEDLWHRHC